MVQTSKALLRQVYSRRQNFTKSCYFKLFTQLGLKVVSGTAKEDRCRSGRIHANV